MHVKDIKATTKVNYSLQQDPTEVGNGKMDWSSLLSAPWSHGVRNFYIEREPPFPGRRIDSVAKSYAYLRDLHAIEKKKGA